MFLGEYQHALDVKGRVILPSKFRARLDEGCVLTKGQDHCLAVYPREVWDRKVAALSEARLTNSQVRNFSRFIFAGASDDGPDKQGRLFIPEPLRRFAGLDREVAVIGAGTHVEIWDRQAWERHQGATEGELSDSSPELPW